MIVGHAKSYVGNEVWLANDLKQYVVRTELWIPAQE